MTAPWNVALPASVEIGGVQYEIRSDYRVALDICAALSDPELSEEDKPLAALIMFYPGFESIPVEHYREAVEKCYWFIRGGEDDPTGKKAPRLLDWEQDFPYIVSPINRVLGQEIRAIPYDAKNNTGGFHWFSFLSAFQEIKECTFAQIVRIRNLKATGKKLDKADQEWYRRNRHLVDFKTKYTEENQERLKRWGI